MDRQLIETTYEMRKLDTSEKIESFDCGDTDLNDFILNESFLYREALLAVSYVLENKVNQRSVLISVLPMTGSLCLILKIKLNSIVSANIGL